MSDVKRCARCGREFGTRRGEALCKSCRHLLKVNPQARLRKSFSPEIQPTLVQRVVCSQCGREFTTMRGMDLCRRCRARQDEQRQCHVCGRRFFTRAGHVVCPSCRRGRLPASMLGADAGVRVCHTCGKPSDGQYWCPSCRREWHGGAGRG